MTAVSVMGGDGSAAAAHHLATGERLMFGACGCGACEFDLVVPVGPVGPAMGRISARRDHWRLDNLGSPPLVVVDLERPQNQVTVGRGHAGVAVPFELARIHDSGQPLATVFGPEPSVLQRTVSPCPAVQRTRQSCYLDPDTTYFAVLVALCEPRLSPLAGAATTTAAVLPTSVEIARSLARRGIPITTRAVDAHIEYLVDKLGLRSAEPATRARRSWRKEALVGTALRRELVAPDYLHRQAAAHPTRTHLRPGEGGGRSRPTAALANTCLPTPEGSPGQRSNRDGSDRGVPRRTR